MSDTTAATTHSITGGLATFAQHRTSRDQRRVDVIKASKIVEVIDLADETFLATVTDIVGVGVDSTRMDGGDKVTAPESLEKSLKGREWESMMLLGKSLVINRNGRMQKYSWNRWAEGWTNVENGTVLIGPLDIGFVVKISVRPAIGYPVEFSLKPNRGRFVGLYRGVGDRKVSVGLSHVKALVNKPWCEFVGSVSY